MANSIIDDMLKEQIPNNNSKKKKNGLWILLILFLIVIIVVAIVGILFLEKKNEITPKAEFLSYVANGNLETILNFDSYNVLMDKMNKESSEVDSEISVYVKTYDGTEIDDIILNVDSKIDVENNKTYMEAALEYLNNELFNLKCLTTDNAIALKSDEIVNRFVGAEYVNLPRIYADITGEELEDMDIQLLTTLANSNIQLPNFSATLLPKYIDVLNKNIDESAFSTKAVTIQKDNGNIDATEYSMTINQTQMINLSEQLLQTIKSDDELINSFSEMFTSFGITPEMIKLLIEELINSLYEVEVDDSITYEVKAYVNNGQTIKLTIIAASEYTFDFEYEYGEKENSVLITAVDSTQTGMKVELSKKISDVSDTMNIVIDAIENSDIIAEFIINSELVNSGTSYELKDKFCVNANDATIEISLNNKINFKDVEIEDLTDENCLFIDQLNEQEFNDVVVAIQNQIATVMTQKQEDLSFITSNTGNTVIEQPIIEEPVDEAGKEEAKNKIVEAVSNAMGEKINKGEEYTLQDVADLVIPDCEYSVDVSEDIAIIIVNGYEFKLDSQFNLSE